MTIPPAKRILIAEDEQAIADSIAYALRTDGFNAQHVTLGAAARERVRAEPPALLVLDVGLPGMSGLELWDRLHRDERLRNVPVMFETAVSKENSAEFLKRGIRNVLQKPFDLNELMANVKELAPPIAA